MRPTQLLMDEHRVIEQVLNCLEEMAARCSANRRLDGEAARPARDFFREYADRRHHGKEENRLFPMMEHRGFGPGQGPVAVMRMEHDQGRQLIRGMELAVEGASSGDAAEVHRWLEHARAYLFMLRNHIQKEDHCLFPMADQAFGEADQRELERQFERVELEEIGEEHRRRYVELADSLADRFDVTRKTPATTR